MQSCTRERMRVTKGRISQGKETAMKISVRHALPHVVVVWEDVVRMLSSVLLVLSTFIPRSEERECYFCTKKRRDSVMMQ